jgi:uncharacterized protein (TIGR03663 family)
MEANISGASPQPEHAAEPVTALDVNEAGAPSPQSGLVTAESPLDRPLSLSGISPWLIMGWLAVFVTAMTLRLMRLNTVALDGGEAALAYDAWTLYRGQPPIIGSSQAAELPLLLQTFSFFLFGATDVVARLVPAFIGLAMVAMPLALRRWIGDAPALGMGALLAISPTMVYASRVISPEIVIAAFSLLALVCLVRLGEHRRGDLAQPSDLTSSSPLAAVLLGAAVGGMFASGPSAISVLITMAVAVLVAATGDTESTTRLALRQLFSRNTLLPFLLAALVTIVLCFTRLLSSPAGIRGIADTFGGWAQLVVTSPSGQPAVLFLAVFLTYELLAVAFALVTLARRGNETGDAALLLATWGVAALALWSVSAGKEPTHAIHVVLPVVLLAGMTVGQLFRDIDWPQVWRGPNGVMALAMVGFVIALAAVGVLLSRVSSLGGGWEPAMPPVAVLCLIAVPLAYAIWRLSEATPRVEGHPWQPWLLGLLVLAVLLGAFGLRSATQLAFYRADTGTEILAQRTSALGTLPSIERFLRLSRDVGIDAGSARDVTGSHSLSIALERDVAWPYVWYFREFPDLAIVEPGLAASSGKQVAIAATDVGLSAAGYSVSAWPWQTVPPPQFLDPDLPEIASAMINPARWFDVWRYLLFRDGVTAPPDAMVSVGLTAELSGRVTTATGPYNLGDHPGSGTEPGQFRDPIGIAAAPDGSIAVVDSGNARVQRFSPDGSFLGIWGNDPSGVTFSRTENGLGPTGITIGPDGRTWVADTWGHRVVALDQNGVQVQAIGGETIDIGDDPARVNESPGLFFGPRAIAVTDDAIYVSDTGNERIQKFSPDGTFLTAWGGYGSAPDQLIEPVGIAIGPDGNVYVADSGNARIAIFTPDGAPIGQWPVPVWTPAVPGGPPPAYQPYLAFDANGNLYATASLVGQGVLLDRDGAIVQLIAQASGERLEQPIGVAVAPNGDVLFTDAGRDSVLTYIPPVTLPRIAASPASPWASPAAP